MSDDAAISTIVTGLSATDQDKDVNSEITYTTTDEFKDYFTYNEATKSIKTSKALLLQGMLFRLIHFNITATDKGSTPLSTTLNCTVRITGENKFAPNLTHASVLNTVIPAAAKAGHPMISINATDDDFGPDGELSFEILSGDPNSAFIISADGLLSLNKIPTVGSYKLNITVSDKASVQKRKYAYCLVIVYFMGKPSVSGNIFVGSMFETVEYDATTGETLTIPIYAQIGGNPLEGLDFYLSYDKEAVVFISAKTDFILLNISCKIRFVGLVQPQQRLIGIVKIAEIKVKALKTGKFIVTSNVSGMYDQLGEYIPKESKPTQATCSSGTIFADVNTDCRFDIGDVALCQTKIRNKEIMGLDVNKNSLIDNLDCTYMLDAYLGRALAVSSIDVTVPKDTVNTPDCLIEIHLSVYDNLVTSPKSSSAFVIVTYSEDVSFNSSDSKKRYPVTSSSIKFVDVFKLRRVDNLFSLKLDVQETITFGLTLVTVSTDVLDTVYTTNMFKISSNVTSSLKTLKLDTFDFNLMSNFVPQFEHMKTDVTTNICLNPVVLTTIGLHFENDFDEVLPTDIEKDEFCRAVGINLLQADQHATLKSCNLTSGSIVATIEVELLKSSKDAFITNLKEDLKDNDFFVTMNGTKLFASNSLVIDGVQTVKPNTVEKDDHLTTIIIVIAVVIVLLMAIAIFLHCYCKRVKSKRVALSKMEALQLSESNTSNKIHEKSGWFSPSREKKLIFTPSPKLFHMQESEIKSRSIEKEERGVVNDTFEMDSPEKFDVIILPSDLKNESRTDTMSTKASFLLKEKIDQFNKNVSPTKLPNRSYTSMSQNSHASPSKSHGSRSHSSMAAIVLPGGKVSPRLQSADNATYLSLPPGSVMGSTYTEETDFISNCGSSDSGHGDSETVGSIRSLKSPTLYKLQSNNEEEIENVDLSRLTVQNQHVEEQEEVVQKTPRGEETNHSPPPPVDDVVDEYSKEEESVVTSRYADEEEEDSVCVSMPNSTKNIDEYLVKNMDTSNTGAENAALINGEKVQLGLQPDFRVLEVKQMRDESQSTFHYIGVAYVNINGSLEEVRKVVTTQASFVAKERFVFVTKRLKLIHPKKEHGIVVNQVYRHSIQIKILRGNDGHNLFCSCGKASLIKCDKCNQTGYCSEKCMKNAFNEHRPICNANRVKMLQIK